MPKPRHTMTLKRSSFSDERGFTLPELSIIIAIMGILAGISIPMWLGMVEGRRVDAAANQLAADLRLAHNKATNQLATWQVRLNPNTGDEDDGTDYFLVKLDASGSPLAASEIPRTLPDNALLNSPTLLPLGTTRAVQFAPDGSASVVGTLNMGAAAADGCPSGTPATGPRVRVTVDESPMHCLTFNAVTSRIKID